MKSLKSFVIALAGCIGVPTYIMAVRPYAVERERTPIAYVGTPPVDNPTAPPNDPEELKGLYYPTSFPGDNKRGELVYIREGCAQCHTQVVRPSHLAVDPWKKHMGKEQTYETDAPVDVRPTYPWDYMHEDFAMFGTHRIGPDLTNLRYRYLKPPSTPADPNMDKWIIDPEKVAKLYQHLYDPRSFTDRNQDKWSNCPSSRHLFETKKKETAAGRTDAISLPGNLKPAEGEEVIPSDEAKNLVQYLLGLKRADPVPSSVTGIKPQKKNN